uniref:Uncharacterized protein n=1 Tax=Cannabis sativa TaxID=3483 RepID=A0A803Q8S5_CANSA
MGCRPEFITDGTAAEELWWIRKLPVKEMTREINGGFCLMAANGSWVGWVEPSLDWRGEGRTLTPMNGDNDESSFDGTTLRALGCFLLQRSFPEVS